MIKTTYKEARKNAVVNGRSEMKEYLKRNNTEIKEIEKIAYYSGIYGLNGYYCKAELTAGYSIYFTTGMREQWIYTIDSKNFGL